MFFQSLDVFQNIIVFWPGSQRNVVSKISAALVTSKFRRLYESVLRRTCTENVTVFDSGDTFGQCLTDCECGRRPPLPGVPHLAKSVADDI